MYFSQNLISKAQKVIELGAKEGLRIACAESCTGGLLSALLTEIPGSSEVFDCGFVTYSNESKTKILGVSEELLNQYGAVSKEVAQEMAIQAAKKSKANIAISITGIAGPKGATAEKPIGLVYIGRFFLDEVIVKKFNFSVTRQDIRNQSVEAAFGLILEKIH